MLSRSAIALTFAAALVANAQPANSAAQEHFQKNVAQYLSVTQSVRDKIKAAGSIDKIQQERLQLAEQIRNVRSGATQGQIFTPDVVDMFRQMLQAALDGPKGKRIRASLRHAEPIHDAPLQVDAKYPDNVPLQSTPPTLLLSLPKLPRGIEYRIVGHALALRDEDSDTVIDFAPDLLPSGTGSKS